MFLSVFGSAWMTWWCIQAYGIAPVELAGIGIVGLGLFSLSLWAKVQHRDILNTCGPELAGRGMPRGFTAINAAQWVIIVFVAWVLSKVGHQDWLAAAIMLIVGAHFLLLAPMFRNRGHYVTGAALMLWAVTYPFVASGGPSSPVGPFVAGLILWLSAIGALLPSLRFRDTRSAL